MKCWENYQFFRLTMLKLRGVFLLAVTATLLIMITVLPETTEATCWETWSRCSNWSKYFSGKLWLKCDPYCKCIGRSGGSCVRSHSTCPYSDKAWSCHCYGSYGPKQRIWCGVWMIETHLKNYYKIHKRVISIFFY